MGTVKLTEYEQKIQAAISSNPKISLTELKNFSRNPNSVKDETIKRAINYIKQKYNMAGQAPPFNWGNVNNSNSQPATTPSFSSNFQQELVELRITTSGNKVLKSDQRQDAEIDFVIDRNSRSIKTRNGNIYLGQNEFEIFEILIKNVGKPVSLENFKDIIYKNWGSKTPHTWADSITRSMTKLRKLIPELKKDNRLLTISSNGFTSYMLR